jgi:hypothetical protein
MKSKLLALTLFMFCGMSFLAANGTVDAKKEKSLLATGAAVEVKEVAADAAKQEVAVADEVAKAEEVAKAKKAEETKAAQDKKSSCKPCK